MRSANLLFLMISVCSVSHAEPSDREPAGTGVTPVVAPAPAESTWEGFRIEGSVDFYTMYNFNKPAPKTATPTAAAPQVQNKYRVFDIYHDDLQLAFARLLVQKSTGRGNVVLDFAYGPSMMVVSGTKADASQINLKQAYLNFMVSDVLNFDAGRFVTPVGYEVIESEANWNHSRGLLFGYLVPFWHAGVKLNYKPSAEWAGSAYVVNGWNNSYEDNRQKCYGLQLAWTRPSSTAIVINLLSGPDAVPASVDAAQPTEVRSVFDATAVVNVTESLSVALNVDSLRHGDATAQGAAGYLRYDMNGRHAVTARFEHVRDPKDLAFQEGLTDGQNLASTTLTFEHKLDQKVWGRLEWRNDRSDHDVFTDTNGPRNSQSTLLLGLTAGF